MKLLLLETAECQMEQNGGLTLSSSPPASSKTHFCNHTSSIVSFVAWGKIYIVEQQTTWGLGCQHPAQSKIHG